MGIQRSVLFEYYIVHRRCTVAAHYLQICGPDLWATPQVNRSPALAYAQLADELLAWTLPRPIECTIVPRYTQAVPGDIGIMEAMLEVVSNTSW